MQVLGTVKRILNTETVGTSGFEKRALHLETEEQYPQILNIEFTQGKVNDLDNYAAGNKVKIDINLKGREWTNANGETVVFNTIQGWKIEKLNN